MRTQSVSAWLSRRFRVDRAAVEMALLFAIVLGVTAFLGLQLQEVAATHSGVSESFGSGQSGEAAAGAAWAIGEVLVAGVLLGIVLVFRRLPEWIQDLVGYNLVIGALMYLGAHFGAVESLATGILIIGGLVTTFCTLDHFEVYWMLNNVWCILLAIFGGIILGLTFGVTGMAIAIVALAIYDHVFANKKSWMFTLLEAIINLRLPVVFIRPAVLRFEWEDLVEDVAEIEEDGDDDEPDTSAWGIGMADMMIPAGFVAAVAMQPGQALAGIETLALVAVIAGTLVACFRLRFEMVTRGSGAGLPALCAGTLVPYAALLALGTLF